MDAAFRALGHAERREILDKLFTRDGQTLAELCRGAEMSRFGVMKHVRVLERARLIRAVRRGRTKVHFLTPAPLRALHERWLAKYCTGGGGSVS